ncbi:ATP synthase F0 subcomplex A subunit [Chitinophaga costaii]|uniref:ATP synthase subunit a n=1 Tax=Chitinophaga costaii TaxID=1335309 RepID=A0A1C4F4A7_9BACT|nr:F0F1 ATP synthase subunit A [Chitinophaga costaii]PUZ22076.1 ATP synthase F0 subunit A [Chitinophaga costaii]SCC50684.1 ATP synthase F0 subcomplex A subunit [Chitinophaga costaii]
MISYKLFKHTLVATLTALCLHGSMAFAAAQPTPENVGTASKTEAATAEKEGSKKIDAKELLLGHVKDSHEWHFFSVGSFHATIPLPVILYSAAKGTTTFSSDKLEDGETSYNGFRQVNSAYRQEHHLDEATYPDGKIIAVDNNNNPTGEKIYDWSITKNITCMILAAILLLWIMISVANTYKANGAKKAPKGLQGVLEPVIIFMRDEVVKPNIPGKQAERFAPFILTLFFFILINNLLGLLPGSANVTGNIAVTAALAIISFIAILISTNRHFWGHIFNPPVPFGVKLILAPVELIGVFTKPISLMIRLFANMLAGHIIILSIIALVFIFGAMNKIAGYGFLPVTIIFNLMMMCLELLVAFIQAFIFATLTAVFIGQSMEGAHDDEHAHGEVKAHH